MNLYDILDVAEDATPDEIRAAWKSAIADLDPTDRRFRAFSDAAGVLLDPPKRAAYDAELAAARVDDEPADAPAEAATETAAEAADAGEADDSEADDSRTTEPEDGPATVEATPTPAAGPAPLRGLWLPALAAVAVVSVALLIWVLVQPGSLGDDSPDSRAEASEAAIRSAEKAAGEMAPVVLAYDYRTFDADVDAASVYFTDDFGAEQRELLEKLKPSVIEGKVVVTTAVPGVALTRMSEDGTRAQVLVFVNQDVEKGKGKPTSLTSAATFDLVSEDGDWLLDEICTEDDCT